MVALKESETPGHGHYWFYLQFRLELPSLSDQELGVVSSKKGGGFPKSVSLQAANNMANCIDN